MLTEMLRKADDLIQASAASKRTWLMNSKQTSGHGLHLISTESHPGELSNPKEVLQEVFDLLEEFSPAWYSEELHSRAIAVLKGN
jgi:hypothetical protein